MTYHEIWIIGSVIVSSIGIGYAIFKGIQSAKEDRTSREEDRKIRFTELLEKFDHDLRRLMDKETTLEEDEVEPYSNTYLNILDRLAYLKKLKKIDEKMIDYFEWYFRFGLRLVEWKVEFNETSEARTVWNHQRNYSKDKGFSILPEDALPLKMIKMLKDKRKEKKNQEQT
jgi:hypothetical protein